MSALTRVQPGHRSLLLPRFHPTRTLVASDTFFTRLFKQSSTRPFSPKRYFSTTRVSRNPDTKSVTPLNPCRTLFVANLPNHATVSDVLDVFRPFGRLLGSRMGHREGSTSVNKGFAHVEFAKLDDAIAAYESHQSKPLWLENRPLVLHYAKESTKTFRPAPSHALHFREFEGGMMALQEVLKEYARHVVRINFKQPNEQEDLPTHGRVYFRSEAIATQALKELGGKVTENGVELKLEYARFKT